LPVRRQWRQKRIPKFPTFLDSVIEKADIGCVAKASKAWSFHETVHLILARETGEEDEADIDISGASQETETRNSAITLRIKPKT
jgi:hypothetical protein